MVISGSSFCFTGSMKRSRREVERYTRENGGTVSHKVCKGTDYLVASNDAIAKLSNKVEDALRLGVEIVPADVFFGA